MALPANVHSLEGTGSAAGRRFGIVAGRFYEQIVGSLVDAAVDMNGERSSPSEIEVFLATHGAAMDLDGDDTLGPLSDGLMVIRYFFGFRDDALIEGAVAATATRTTSDKIKACIEASLP